MSSVVVNRENVETGNMEPKTLKGFCDAGRELGLSVTDEQAFLREHQTRLRPDAGNERMRRPDHEATDNHQGP